MMEKWNEAKQCEGQSVLAFITHLQTLEANMFLGDEVVVPEFTHIKFTIAKLLLDIHCKLNHN